MAYTTITSGQTDANSPVDVALMDTLRTNQDHLLSILVTNGDAHDHAGGDGALIPQLGLKQGAGEVFISVPGTSSAETPLLPGGRFGFVPAVKSASVGSSTFNGLYVGTLTTDYLAPNCLFSNSSAGSIAMYASQTYIQASPPYKLGNEQWNHFLYLLVNAQGDVIASYEAEDPPYAYNGPTHNSKDSIERIQAVPHPFMNYWNKDPGIDGLEIVLVDLRDRDIKKWKKDNEKQGKGILEDLGNIDRKGKIITPQELGIQNIQGFTDRVKIRKA